MKEELREEIPALQEDIEEWEAEFDVQFREALESTLADGEPMSAAIRERTRILREWERYDQNKHLVNQPLDLCDDACELSPEQDHPSNSSGPLVQYVQ